MNKKGSDGTNTPLTLIMGLTLMSLLLASCGLFAYNITKDQPNVWTSTAHSKFLTHYQLCANQANTRCVCDDFEFTIIKPDEQIVLHQLPDAQVQIQLMREGYEEPIKATTLYGVNLCNLNYQQQMKQFVKVPVEKQVVSVSQDPNLASKWDYYLTLYKEGKDLCFVNYAAVPQQTENWWFNYKVKDPRNPRVEFVEDQVQKKYPNCAKASGKEEDGEETSQGSSSSLFEL